MYDNANPFVWKRVTDAMAEEWRSLEGDYLARGLSRHEAHQQIADAYGYCRRTVLNHCRPELLATERERARARGPQQRPTGYWQGYWRQKSERVRHYRRHYRDVETRLDHYLRGLLQEDQSFTLGEVTEGLRRATGIRFRPITIRNRLARYANRDGCSPVLYLPDGGLRLNRAYYQRDGR
jgi:hypothetical protein